MRSSNIRKIYNRKGVLMIDWISLAFQTKSVVQVLCGDLEGARRAQENFRRQFPIVPHVGFADMFVGGDKMVALQANFECERIISSIFTSTSKSLVQAIFGDCEWPRRTFSMQYPIVCPISSAGRFIGVEKQCLSKNIISSIVSLTTGICFVEGVTHYAFGDNEGGDAEMKHVARIIGVSTCGIGGRLIFGPTGSILGGSVGGFLMDLVITKADSAIHGEYRPYGYFQKFD